MKNDDSPQQLRDRLAALLDGVEKVYERMLDQIPSSYRQEASMFLQIALLSKRESYLEPDTSLSIYALALCDNEDSILGLPDEEVEDKLIAFSVRACHRIALTCRGWLEICDMRRAGIVRSDFPAKTLDGGANVDERDLNQAEKDPTIDIECVNEDPDRGTKKSSKLSAQTMGSDYSHLYMSSRKPNIALHIIHESVRVDFIHRSAVDFVRDCEQGRVFIKANDPSQFHPQVLLAKVLLARTKLYEHSYEDLRKLMQSIWLAEHETAVAQPSLLRILDTIMWKLDHDKHGHNESHWSIRWESPCHSIHGRSTGICLNSEMPYATLVEPLSKISFLPDLLKLDSGEEEVPLLRS